MEERPLCECHGEPQRWCKSTRCTAGGYWACRVSDLAQKRDRYDADAVYRISKNLHDHSRRRTQTLNRMRERLEGIRGEVQA